jgi:crotonobetainyl-CoA:carnitine CoA-transferase CaiB-like acyl-CoA transferase
MSDSKAVNGNLTGVRVLEIGNEQGEYCGLTLAGLGADVVKIEPPEGNSTRSIGPFVDDVVDRERSLFFWAYNRGKRSVALDLTDAGGQAKLRRLLASADVLLDSTPRGYLASIGVGTEQLEASYPSLVTARISPFGDDGPWADYKASDLVHLALGGPLMNCGYDPRPDGTYDLPPMAPQAFHSFHIAGEQVVLGVIAALIYRNRTGSGQRLTCAVHEAVSKNTEMDLMSWVVQHQPIYRQTARHAGPIVDEQITIDHTKDGRWLNFVSIGAKDRNNIGPYLARYGMDAGLGEAQPSEVGSRDIPGTKSTRNASSGVEAVQRLTRKFTFEELPWQEMQAAGMFCAPLRKPHENALDDHWLGRGTYAQIEHPETGKSYPYPVSKWVASGSTWCAGRRAPLLGEDNEIVLSGWAPRSSPVVTRTRSLESDPRLSVHQKPFALSDTKIFDFSWFLASAGGTRFLAALGADVVKVEWKAHPDTRGGGFPPGGRAARETATGPLEAAETGPMGVHFNNKNPGKRGISLNVRHPKGREIAEEFLRWSNVVAEGFSPGVFERWGFGWERLQEINPTIIYAQQSGMGGSGTYGRYRAVGPIAAALSGLTEMGGLPEPALPTGWGYSYLDWMGANSFAMAIAAAIYQRDLTGAGQWIDASQTEVGLFMTAVPLLDWSVNGRPWTRSGNRSKYDRLAPQGVYHCAGEDRWVAITCASDDEWVTLAKVAEHPEWANDERFSTVDGRIKYHDEIDRLIAGWTCSQDRYTVMEALQTAGIAAGVAQNVEDRCEADPQLAHLEWLTEVPNPSVGTWPVGEVPFDLSETPPHIGGPINKGAPVYGEHNYEVYNEVLGLSETEVDALVQEGVI